MNTQHNSFDRRRFLTGLAGVVGLAAMAGWKNWSHADRATGSYAQASVELAKLANSRFAGLGLMQEIPLLISRLEQKGVLTLEGEVRPAQVAELAQWEPLVSYEGFFYTPTELELYTLALMLTAQPEPVRVA